MRIVMSRSHIQAAIEGLRKLQCGSLPAVVKIEATGRRCCFSMGALEEQAVYEAAQVSVREAGCVFVALADLVQFGKTKGDDEVRIESSDSQVTFVSSHAGVALPYPVSLLADPELGDAKAMPRMGSRVAGEFLHLLRKAFRFASNDPTREVLTGICLDAGTKDKCIVATDGRRASAFKFDLPTKGQVILPNRKFLLWTKLEEPLAIAANDERFRLDAGPWTYCTKLIAGQYPNWRQVLPDVQDAATLSFTDEQVSTLKALLPSLPTANPHEPSVLLCRRNGQVAVCSQNGVDGNWQAVPVGGQDGGADFEALLNRQYVLDALNAGFTDFKVGGYDVPLLSQTRQGDIHALMPMSLHGVSLESIMETITTLPQHERIAVKRETVPVLPAQVHQEVTITPQAKEEKAMQEVNTTQGTALDRLQDLYRQAREKVREANSALADIASCIRDVVREEKQVQAEMATVRAGLNKLKAITV
jgi:hypothetical protein